MRFRALGPVSCTWGSRCINDQIPNLSCGIHLHGLGDVSAMRFRALGLEFHAIALEDALMIRYQPLNPLFIVQR